MNDNRQKTRNRALILSMLIFAGSGRNATSVANDPSEPSLIEYETIRIEEQPAINLKSGQIHTLATQSKVTYEHSANSDHDSFEREIHKAIGQSLARDDPPMKADSYLDWNSEPPDPDWYPQAIPAAKRLANIPAIGPIKQDNKLFAVTVTNTGQTILHYSACRNLHSVEYVLESRQNGKWRRGRRNWCGTRVSGYEIQPQETVMLFVSFRNANRRERTLAYFSEKGAERGEFVVLATEPEILDNEPLP